MHADNVRSQRAVERLGAQRTGTHVDGQGLHQVTYRLEPRRGGGGPVIAALTLPVVCRSGRRGVTLRRADEADLHAVVDLAG